MGSWALLEAGALAGVVQTLPGPVISSAPASLPLLYIHRVELPPPALSPSAKLPSFGFFFFLNQSLCYLSLPLLMHFCFPLSGSSVTLPPAGWWPVSITQNCALSPMSLCLEFAVPVLTQCLPTVNLFARKANQAEPKGDAPPCKSQLSCTSAACRSSCFCVNPKAQALEFLLYCWLGVEKDLEVTR